MHSVSATACSDPMARPEGSFRQLHQRVNSALAGSPYFAGRQLRVEADHGRVTLLGTVHSYYQKQMAQEIVRRLDGVAEVDNRLQVDWSDVLTA